MAGLNEKDILNMDENSAADQKTPGKDAAEGKPSLRRKRSSAAKRKSEMRLPRRRHFGKRELLFVLIPAAAAVIAMAIVLLLMERENSYTLEEQSCQYYADSAAYLESGTKLIIGENNDTILQYEGEEIATSLPIYSTTEEKIIVTSDMLYYQPRLTKYNRVTHFTEVSIDSHGMISFKKENAAANPGQGFLYDGKNYYLFLEPVRVKLPNYTVELPAMSYVEADYGGEIILFNYETKKTIIEPCEGIAVASAGGGDYDISLLGDSLTTREGKRMLLSSRPELYDPIP